MPDGDFFAFGEYDWGLLRLIYAVIWENKGTVTMDGFNTIQKTWVRTEGVEGAIGKPPRRLRRGDSPAKIKTKKQFFIRIGG